MYTVVETSIYSRKVVNILTEDEHDAFTAYISQNPNIGSVVKGTGGVRKVRWAIRNKGKSAGARVIYFNRLVNGEIWLLTIYSKNENDNIPANVLKIMREEIDSGN